MHSEPVHTGREVVVTCALTGAADTVSKHPALPVTPREIAEAALEARDAGAAVAHIHVRDPETGAPAHLPELYREVVERLRDAGTDLILNLTTGMDGMLPPGGHPDRDVADARDRMGHVLELKPEICSLDCGSFNVGDNVYLAPRGMLRDMARAVREAGVKPELEVFDLGHIRQAAALVEEGLVDAPPLIQFCMGVPWGVPADPACMLAMRGQLPAGAIWSGFSTGRNQFPFAAQAVLLGGHVRVGLEDNLYLEKGVLATNGQLVERAVQLIEFLGCRAATPARARELYHLDGGA